MRRRHRPRRGVPRRRALRRMRTVLLIMGWVLAGPWLLPGGARALPHGEAQVPRKAERQALLQAHPEWEAGVRAAVVAGIICAGMPPEMVRAAWGRPTRISGRGAHGQPVVWHYAGRPSAVERLGGPWRRKATAHEWTVAFSHGRVVGWTD
jgi:hypothetical protein